MARPGGMVELAVERGRRPRGVPSQPTTTKPSRGCVPVYLPPDGIIRISPDQTITLRAGAVFTPPCARSLKNADDGDQEMGGLTNITDAADPFHASITPQAYATGAATVIAWMLVIMLFITPRTFFVGGVGGRSGLMGRGGMISGASGGGSITGVGTRPWLQKVAAMTVAVSLTLATADTFEIAERQYADGFMNASALREEVVGGTEIRVSRVISDVFLWLAQVQTLIRLFPRHKEKVIIKWVGFALILLDITFSSLNSFGPYNNKRALQHFDTAIPALSYLFQLSLSMLYAAWVIYYAITKRRYAFYHSMMWNISIIALLSMVAVLTPVVFFITDISNDSIAGWGDYFRWVGAAAASVIVWEWVERIEALEREERKDGILGREIYDGDEMLQPTPYTEVNWPRSHHEGFQDDLGKRRPGGGAGGGGSHATGAALFSMPSGRGFSRLANRFGRSNNRQLDNQRPGLDRDVPLERPAGVHQRGPDQQSVHNSRNFAQYPTPPPPIVSPVSRTDTTSADSTVYTIRYHPISSSPPIERQPVAENHKIHETLAKNASHDASEATLNVDVEKAEEANGSNALNRSRWKWQNMGNPFKRGKALPPAEVQRGRVIEPLGIDDVPVSVPAHNYSRWAIKARLGAFAAEQGERIREKTSRGQPADTNLPVTIIPAQPRGRTWSPELLQQQKSQSNQQSETSSFGQGTTESGRSQRGPLTANNSLSSSQPGPSSASPAQGGRQSPSPSGSNAGCYTHRTPESLHPPGERPLGAQDVARFRPPLPIDLGSPQRVVAPSTPRDFVVPQTDNGGTGSQRAAGGSR